MSALDHVCYFLADRPWTTCALLCAVNLSALCLDVVLP